MMLTSYNGLSEYIWEAESFGWHNITFYFTLLYCCMDIIGYSERNAGCLRGWIKDYVICCMDIIGYSEMHVVWVVW